MKDFLLEALRTLGALLVLAAMVAAAFLLAGGGPAMDDTPRSPHPYCEHAP